MQSINLTAAFAVTQLFLLIIMFGGLLIFGRGNRGFSDSHVLSLFTAFALLTLGTLIFSVDLLGASQPLFGDIFLPTISRELAFLIVFSADLIWFGLVIGVTGGSSDSPFSSLLVTLPALAIFLHETPTRFLSYSVAAGIVYMAFQSTPRIDGESRSSNERRASRFVALCCLALSTMLGYATRPH